LEYLIDYRKAKGKLKELGVGDYLKRAEKMQLDPSEIVPVFEKCFFRSWLDAIVPQYTAVSEFRRHRQEERIAAFKKLDKLHIEITKAALVSELIRSLPNFDSYSSDGEMALLRREMSKKKKLMPTRLLIAGLPNLLPKLKPCVMMSPLSVSTYLGSSNFEFDTVIFDEASQIRTQDAIGAIFRAKQVIIVGDSKQLPPTDFFTVSLSSSNEYDEDEDGAANDAGAYESLLDEAVNLPTQTLKWHYRSRHEHLIAFSNAKIYGGDLITFPSTSDNMEGMGVEYIKVDGGIYDRGGRNGNKKEAMRVADFVFEHFHSYPDRSLGIIAFNEVQQSVIQDVINERRRADPTFETFFKEDKWEYLFIKNLETVQGDERDTIIFSIGFAHDSAGKFIMNFGPLSKDGGERDRLRQAVLEDMGWKIYRVWSTYWTKHRSEEEEHLLAEVKNAIENYSKSPSTLSGAESEWVNFLSLSAQTADEKKREGHTLKMESLRSDYHGWQVKDIPQKNIAETILKVLDNDYGLSKEGLFRETALYGYGWKKLGSKIKDYLEMTYNRLIQQGTIEEVDGKIKRKSKVGSRPI
jgi:very-short-patch-repair endonuclease